jgi:CRISPR-associated protein Cas2
VSEFFVVCFDVRDKHRLRKVSRELENFGYRVQYSLFECLLDEKDLQTLKKRLAKLIDPELDQVRYYRLCAKDLALILLNGSGIITTEPDYHLH